MASTKTKSKARQTLVQQDMFGNEGYDLSAKGSGAVQAKSKSNSIKDQILPTPQKERADMSDLGLNGAYKKYGMEKIWTGGFGNKLK